MLTDLNTRESNGFTVALLWDDETGHTFIEWESSEEWERFQVASEAASDAFLHPLVYSDLARNAGYRYAFNAISETR